MPIQRADTVGHGAATTRYLAASGSRFLGAFLSNFRTGMAQPDVYSRRHGMAASAAAAPSAAMGPAAALSPPSLHQVLWSRLQAPTTSVIAVAGALKLYQYVSDIINVIGVCALALCVVRFTSTTSAVSVPALGLLAPPQPRLSASAAPATAPSAAAGVAPLAEERLEVQRCQEAQYAVGSSLLLSGVMVAAAAAMLGTGVLLAVASGNPILGACFLCAGLLVGGLYFRALLADLFVEAPRARRRLRRSEDMLEQAQQRVADARAAATAANQVA